MLLLSYVTVVTVLQHIAELGAKLIFSIRYLCGEADSKCFGTTSSIAFLSTVIRC